MNPQVLSNQSNIYITFIASLLIWLMGFGLLILWIIDGKIKKEQVLHAIFSILLAWLVSLLLKELIPSARPFIQNGRPPLTLTVPDSVSSFPSSHATVAFALAVSVWLHDKRAGIYFLFCAFFVGLGRIMGNVHFFWDVMAGGVLGGISALAIKRLHVFKALR